MTAPQVLDGIAAVVFLALAVWRLRHALLGPTRAEDRVSDLLRVLAMAAMAAIAWARAVLPAVEVVLFTAAAIWFVRVALLDRPGEPAAGRGALGRRLAPWVEAALMASVVWAVIVVAGEPGAGGATTGTTGVVQLSAARGTAAAVVPAVTAVLGALLAAAAVWSLLQALREPLDEAAAPGPLHDLDASAVTAGGMSFAFLALLTRS